MLFFLFLPENICCGYSLELTQRDGSNEHHKICLSPETSEIFRFLLWTKCALSNGTNRLFDVYANHYAKC